MFLDEENEVWVLLAINYFGFIWGPVGMIISVPILSVLMLDYCVFFRVRSGRERFTEGLLRLSRRLKVEPNG